MVGFPIDFKTVSSVRSIFRMDLVRISCFLKEISNGPRCALDGTHFEDRLPRFDSSKMHSWLPAWQRLHGGPCSAPTHFIFSRRQTVHALENSLARCTLEIGDAYREPRVGFTLSSFSIVGLRALLVSSSLRGFFLASLARLDDEGRFPLLLEEDGYICSVGGVAMRSEPCEDGDE